MSFAASQAAHPFSPWGRRWIARSARRMRGRHHLSKMLREPSSAPSGHLLPQGEKGCARRPESERQASAGQDRICDADRVLQDFVVPEADDREPLFLKPGVADEVAPVVRMLRAVAFNDQTVFVAEEVRHVVPERCLTSPLEVRQAATSQNLPKLGLGIPLSLGSLIAGGEAGLITLRTPLRNLSPRRDVFVVVVDMPFMLLRSRRCHRCVPSVWRRGHTSTLNRSDVAHMLTSRAGSLLRD